MSTPATASPTHVAKKGPKKAMKPKTSKATPSHPTYSVMIKAALVALKEHKGSSRAAILKYILQHYKVGDNINKVNAHLRQALKKGATSGFLKQTKGVGASGSFRLGDKKTEGHKKVARKPAAKKAHGEKKPKKAAAAKKPAAAHKKKAAGPKKPKSPKKVKLAKKPSATKPKKAASPKKKAAKPKAAKKAKA
ncbi:unnamed protein product [Toxocara canis]|nr:unnamed protein product [Toxocara canis]